ncbi:MAG: cyclopropane-fatty-acyl-phospholipid synthase family protein [Gemmataceae bacterium]
MRRSRVDRRWSCAEIYGKISDRCPLRTSLQVHDPRVWSRLAFGGTIAAGETYVEGMWEADDLPAFLRITLRNAHVFDGIDNFWSSLAARWHRFKHWLRPNSLEGSRTNIAAHYDLGNDFFALFLDETLAYSSAIFADEATPLLEASLAKFDHVCRKLELTPKDHLLEIGTGWGGLAMHAAQKFGCKVTTTTISKEQHAFASRRVQEAGLSDRVNVLLSDYRHLTGSYDKLVSIEMIEAVGEAYLDEFFARCSQRLKPNGMMLLQSITIADEHFDRYRTSSDFIQRYIFPGGFLPSVGAMASRCGKGNDLRMTHLEDFGLHYAQTLRHWRRRFLDRLGEARALGYPDDFLRLWDYYFAYCEAGFEECRTGLVQAMFAKAGWRPTSL